MFLWIFSSGFAFCIHVISSQDTVQIPRAASLYVVHFYLFEIEGCHDASALSCVCFEQPAGAVLLLSAVVAAAVATVLIVFLFLYSW